MPDDGKGHVESATVSGAVNSHTAPSLEDVLRGVPTETLNEMFRGVRHELAQRGVNPVAPSGYDLEKIRWNGDVGEIQRPESACENDLLTLVRCDPLNIAAPTETNGIAITYGVEGDPASPQIESRLRRIIERVRTGLNSDERASIAALPEYQRKAAGEVLQNLLPSRLRFESIEAGRADYSAAGNRRFSSRRIRARINQTADTCADILAYAHYAVRRARTDFVRYTSGVSQSLLNAQNPGTLVIKCSDSRVLGTYTDIGEEFKFSNAGSEVIRCIGKDDGGRLIFKLDDKFETALCYAIEKLKIKDVVLTSHGGCGAAKAVMDKIHETVPSCDEVTTTGLRDLSRRLSYLPEIVGKRGAEHFIDMMGDLYLNGQSRYLAGELALGILQHHLVSRFVDKVNEQKREEYASRGETWTDVNVHLMHIGLRKETGPYTPYVYQPAKDRTLFGGRYTRLKTRFDRRLPARPDKAHQHTPSCSCGHHHPGGTT